MTTFISSSRNGRHTESILLSCWTPFMVAFDWPDLIIHGSRAMRQPGKFLKIIIYLCWLCSVFITAHGLSLVVAPRLKSMWAPYLCLTGLVAHGMWDLSSLTSDQTHIPCTGRWILNHWTTGEVPFCQLSVKVYLLAWVSLVFQILSLPGQTPRRASHLCPLQDSRAPTVEPMVEGMDQGYTRCTAAPGCGLGPKSSFHFF